MPFIEGDLVFPDRVERGRIGWTGELLGAPEMAPLAPVGDGTCLRWDGFIAPGFLDIHVHGGDGADFMDGTVEAFHTVCRAHARHGTTRVLATSPVGTVEQIDRFLELCDSLLDEPTGGARVAGAHFYGPYFAPAAKGCHPGEGLGDPENLKPERFLKHRCVRTATVAPELPGSAEFLRECRRRGIVGCLGHSHATFTQVREAVEHGAAHVDHLFCAMSDRARLRLSQAYPMRGGLFEATLGLDALTTEVIADDRHLADELLYLAYKVKGPDRLALVTDSMRAMDMPDGEYWFGMEGKGEAIRKADGVGLTLDPKGLASAVQGLEVGLRSMKRASGAPLHEVVRMLTLTPARIAGLADRYGSLEAGKAADLVLLDQSCE
ncbi:MAG: N-acetylglucosamine-6-phosphate deacetylase, partial [Gemmataceae bacterium]